jgi:hypothetical protein
MARFSERMGVTPPKTVLQLESMDSDLRNGLWNVCYDLVFGDFLKQYFQPRDNPVVAKLWRLFFKKPVDEISYDGDEVLEHLKIYFFKSSWDGVYDLIEFLVQIGARYQLEDALNRVLEREKSGYRFVKYTLTPITNEQELAAVQSALELPTGLSAVRQHIRTAVALFSDRKSPDYRNSIKESISAVEGMCIIITGDQKATLGQALKKLEEKGIQLHAALKNSFSSLYGYTSDADGIRHALLEESTLDFDDAKFMLVSCSGFVNYLAAKAARAGVIAAQ